MTEFTVRLANRPGQLAKLARLLADAGVSIEALAAVAENEHSQVRLVVESAPLARRALMNAALEFEERAVLDTFLPRGEATLAYIAEELGHAGVNIESMYLLHSSAEGLHFALTVDDDEIASRTLAG